MIDEHLDFLLDTWTSRVNDQSVTDCVTFSTTKRLIKMWSTKPLLVD